MRENDFNERRGAAWEEFDQLVARMEETRGKVAGAEELPRKFRGVCADLALATSRMYRAATLQRLNGLVIRGYKQLYRPRPVEWSVQRFIGYTFPHTVRANWRLFLLCSALFWLPFFLLLAFGARGLDWLQAILGPGMMSSLEQMYGDGGESLAEMRAGFGSNFRMFGHYIQNNIGIDFRIFAGGMAAGLGTIFYLIANGVQIGASAAYVHYACNPESFWSFVAGHSSFELIGMVIAGMAGMKMGLAILRPGRVTRPKAIGMAAHEALPLIIGAAGMTAIAAVIEGFWSAQDLPHMAKYTFGGVMWALHLLYFGLLGRGAA